MPPESPSQPNDPLIPTRALRLPSQFRLWLSQQVPPRMLPDSVRELDALRKELWASTWNPRLSDVWPLLSRPGSPERPAEKTRRHLRQRLDRKRASQRQGWISALRHIKEAIIREGFNWDEIVLDL